MIRINLLPVRQIKKRIKSRNELLVLLAGLFVLLLVLATVGYGQVQKISNLNGTMSDLKKEQASYAATIKKIKDIEKAKKILETKMQVIKGLKANSQMPVRILDEVTYITPSGRVWLKTMDLQGNSLNITGIALDNETIAQYMLDFVKSPYFSKAELKSSSMAEVGGQKLKSFVLNVSVEKPASEGGI